MRFLEKIVDLINKLFVVIAGAFLIAMMLLTCADIVGRLAGSPIKGTVELISFFGAITATFALAYTQIKRDHICVTVLVDMFPRAVKVSVGIVNDTICMLFSLIAAVQIAKIGRIIFNSGEVTETLRIVFYPFIYAAAAGFAALVLVFLAELVKAAVKGITKEPTVVEREFETQDN